MQIVRIQIQGLKSHDKTYELSGQDAILGAARSGKSSLRQALMFAATGKNPDVGKKLSDAGLLMHGNEMAVRVEWEDGSFAERVLLRKGKSLTERCHASWLGEDANATDSKAAVLQRFGGSDVEAIQNLDLGHFIGLTGPEQSTAVNALLDGSGMAEAEILERLHLRSALRLVQGGDVREPDDPAAWPAVRAGAAAQLGEAHFIALESFTSQAATYLPEEGMAGTINWAKRLVADLAREEKTKLAAREEIEDRDARHEAPALTIAQLDEQRQAKTDRIAVLRSEIQRHAEGTRARALAEQSLEAAQAALDEIESDGPIKDAVAALAKKAADLRIGAAEKREPEEIPAPNLVVLDQAVIDRCEAMEAEADGLDEGLALPEEPVYEVFVEEADLSAVMASKDVCYDKVERAKRDDWTHVADLADALPLDVPQRQPLLDLADKNRPDLEAAQAEFAAASDAVREALEQREKARAHNAETHVRNEALREAYRAELAAVNKKRDEAKAIRGDASVLRGEEMNRVQAANQLREAEYRRKCADRAVAIDTIRRDKAAAFREADAMEDRARGLKERHAEALAHVQLAQSKLDGMAEIAPLDVEQHEVEIATLQQEIARLDETKRQVEGADARKRELEDLTREIDAATAAVDVARAIAWALPLIRDEDLAARRGPILDRMTRFLDASGVGEMPYLEAVKGTVAYGLAAGAGHPHLDVGERRSGLVLSGAESVLFNAALWFAIVSLRAPHTKVLAVEIDDLDDEMALAFFKGCDAILDDLDNAIVCTNRALPIPKAWTRHVLDKRLAMGGAA